MNNEYTNEMMLNDIKAMQAEIENQDPNSDIGRMHEDARQYFDKPEHIEKKAYPYFKVYVNKYPALFSYPHSKPLFDQIVRDKPVDIEMLENLNRIAHQQNTNKVSKLKAETMAGKILAKKFLPEDDYKTAMEVMNDPAEQERLMVYYERQTAENEGRIQPKVQKMNIDMKPK